MKSTYGGKRIGAGPKPQPPRIARNCLIVNLTWLKTQKPSPTLEKLLNLAASK
jgi:hypothetical protein